MYKIFNILSLIVRQYYLPNPYLLYFSNSLYADIFNLFIGGSILHMLSFFLTSSVYNKGTHPGSIGCILYCISYIFNTFLIQNLCNIFEMVKIDQIVMIATIIKFVIYFLLKIIFGNVKKYKVI